MLRNFSKSFRFGKPFSLVNSLVLGSNSSTCTTSYNTTITTTPSCALIFTPVRFSTPATTVSVQQNTFTPKELTALTDLYKTAQETTWLFLSDNDYYTLLRAIAKEANVQLSGSQKDDVCNTEARLAVGKWVYDCFEETDEPARSALESALLHLFLTENPKVDIKTTLATCKAASSTQLMR
jgi:hypothetical protein